MSKPVHVLDDWAYGCDFLDDRRMTASSAGIGASSRSWFFPAMGALALFAVMVGFFRTYTAPMLRGTFNAPIALHLHGAFALAWVLLFFTQPLLVRLGHLRWHKRLGWAGVPIATGVMVTMIPAGLFQVARDTAAGSGPTAVSALLGVLTSGLMFLSLVVAGVVARRRREAHARFLLLATLVVIWPAWFRFRHWLPSVPRPEIWFALVAADVWIVVAMVHDQVRRGAVQPVLAWGGTAVMLEQTVEVLVFDSPVWRSASRALYGWLQA